MAKEDYYKTLGVERGADGDTLKKAYRSAAMKYHPDRNPGDKAAEAKFKEINEAYDVLRDEQKRAAYDRFGHAAFENGGGGRPGGAAGFASGGFADIFEEMFGEFMGGGGARRGGQQSAGRGADLRFNMQIDLDEAFAGKTATIRVPASTKCEECDGSGAEKGSQPVTCPGCGGRGRQRVSQGFFSMERACSQCGGSGRVIERPCRRCNGAGRVRKEKTLSVNVPAGVEDGTRIRLAGEGETGLRGAPPGDLYIFLAIRPHALYERDGADLHCKVPVSIVAAALGGTVEVPGIDGSRLRVAVPVGAQSGQQMRLRGKGMSVLRSHQRGDLYVHLAVETPVQLSKKQEELLREFDKAGAKGKSHSPEADGFLAKIKSLFKEVGE